MIFHHKFAIDPEQGFQVKNKWIKIEVDSPKRESAVTEVNQAVTNPKLSEFILCYKCQDKIEGDYLTEPIVQNRIIVAEPTEITQKDCVSVCNSKQLDLQKHKEKEKTLVGCHNETNVLNSEMTYSPVSNLKTCSNDTLIEHRVENMSKTVKNKCENASGPKMPEVVLRNIVEETESSRIEENMYKRGDLVYMYKESSSQKKLKRHWDGPFVVVKCVSPSAYHLQGKKRTIIVHRDRLKPCTLEENDLPIWAKKVVAHCRESSQ